MKYARLEAARRQKQGGREVKTEMASVQSFVAFTFTLSLSRISTPAFSQLLRLRGHPNCGVPSLSLSEWKVIGLRLKRDTDPNTPSQLAACRFYGHQEADSFPV